MAIVKADVENYYALLNERLNRHISLEGLIGEQSNELEQKRKAMAADTYGYLGLLMHHSGTILSL